jgi:hypothetical protein
MPCAPTRSSSPLADGRTLTTAQLRNTNNPAVLLLSWLHYALIAFNYSRPIVYRVDFVAVLFIQFVI